MWMTEQNVIKALGQALKDRAPQAYQEMERSGELTAFLKGRARTMIDEAMEVEMRDQAPPELTGMEVFQYKETAGNRAWRTALEEAVADLPIEMEEASDEADL